VAKVPSPILAPPPLEMPPEADNKAKKPEPPKPESAKKPLTVVTKKK
jgi:hypothetical protein